MERIAQYRQIIHCLLEDYPQFYATISDAGVDTDVIQDDVQ